MEKGMHWGYNMDEIMEKRMETTVLFRVRSHITLIWGLNK